MSNLSFFTAELENGVNRLLNPTKILGKTGIMSFKRSHWDLGIIDEKIR